MSQLAKDMERLTLPVATEVSYADPALTGGIKPGAGRGTPPPSPAPNTFYVTFVPHEYLWIEDPVTFEFRVPISYSAMPPAVSCKDEAFVAKHGERVEIDSSGQVLLNILKLGSCAWMRGYTVSDVIHCIHHKLQVPDIPQVKIITPMSTPVGGSAIRSRKSDGGAGGGGPSGVSVPLASGEFGLQGKRPTMEDQTVCIDRLALGDGRFVGFYAVYDGHGGAAASKFASERVHTQFVDNVKAGMDLRKALYAAFRSIDADFEAEHKGDDSMSSSELSGTTAAVVVVEGSKVVAGNVGDSRAVMSRDGNAVALTDDHKANRPDEIARIVNAGGFVVHNRVMGRLAVSRAIGDIAFKTGTNGAQMVTGAPELFETVICEKDELIVIGCDGLFDVMSSQQVISFARAAMSDGAGPEEVAKQLALEALKLGSNDNISVVCVKIADGVPRGSVRRGPAMMSMAESAMSEGASTAAAAAAAAAAATTKSASFAASGGSSRRAFSNNPFSKSYNAGDGGPVAARRPAATPAPAEDRRTTAGVQVESMVSAMRLSDGEPLDDDALKLPPSNYGPSSFSTSRDSLPTLSAVSAAGGGSSGSSMTLSASSGSDASGGSSPFAFNVPGLPTYGTAMLSAPPFAASPKSSRSNELSKQEEEDLMDAILHDTAS